MTMGIRSLGFSLLLVSLAWGQPALRPPAVPLVTCDPYFSVWSFADSLTGDWPRHWTGSIQAFASMIRIDGMTFRLMGSSPSSAPALHQTSLKLTPTTTRYSFEGHGIGVTMSFLTPLLPKSLDVFSRPVTYLTWEISSTDGQTHDVSVYIDNSAEIAVNTSGERVVWSRLRSKGLDLLSFGTQAQQALGASGDDLRINWGYFTLASASADNAEEVIAAHDIARGQFAAQGTLPADDDTRMPRAADDEWPVLAKVFRLGHIGTSAVSRHVLLAYDEQYSIEFLHRKLRPYWRRDEAEVSDLLYAAETGYDSLRKACAEFDRRLTHDLTEAGGEHYAQLAILAYRQCLAAHTLAVDIDGTPMLFPKENFSNGCISTVDVIYPSSPLFLALSPELMRALLTPVMQYASSARWRFPFAPHDLGTYPLANGQVYGGGERSEQNQMPVEESANLILLLTALAHAEGSASYAEHYWHLVETWAAYLKQFGVDPASQLCTDDFAGHLAHNANLSVKAILAIASYGTLCEMTGRKDEAARCRNLAREWSTLWQKKADDGDHYRLAFDQPGTWSQKYNLVWDRILGLNIFPAGVTKKEIGFYLNHQNRYGLPLDNRKDYTKLDWLIWSATLADSVKDWDALTMPAYRFANESPSRVPLTDWYWTTDGKQVGFQARSVVGGIFIKFLSLPRLWKEWSRASR